MEVEAPPTPEKDGGGPTGGPARRAPGTAPCRGSASRVPSSSTAARGPGGSGPGVVGPGDGPHLDLTLGGSLDDEERKIRVGTYLEGGPCGTYAVASKSGLLVYPTLFEHTLPDAMRGDRDNDVARGVEDIVKKHRSRSRGEEEGGGGGGEGRRRRPEELPGRRADRLPPRRGRPGRPPPLHLRGEEVARDPRGAVGE
ncbi:hypothetical protein THAOC_13946, partial [Thalassiosira oceanica]